MKSQKQLTLQEFLRNAFERKSEPEGLVRFVVERATKSHLPIQLCSLLTLSHLYPIRLSIEQMFSSESRKCWK